MRGTEEFLRPSAGIGVRRRRRALRSAPPRTGRRGTAPGPRRVRPVVVHWWSPGDAVEFVGNVAPAVWPHVLVEGFVGWPVMVLEHPWPWPCLAAAVQPPPEAEICAIQTTGGAGHEEAGGPGTTQTADDPPVGGAWGTD